MRRQQEEMMRRQQEGFKGGYPDAVGLLLFAWVLVGPAGSAWARAYLRERQSCQLAIALPLPTSTSHLKTKNILLCHRL